jgi:nucleoside 2-deoxyribosyltransferase
MKIYVASSWRNEIQPQVVEALKNEGHNVYDFKNPSPGDHGFHWSEIDPNWKQWDTETFRKSLDHPIANRGFAKDMNALEECDMCVIVLPCGRSAHFEAGYAIGAGKPTVIYIPKHEEPELMYKMADGVCSTMDEVLSNVKNVQNASFYPNTSLLRLYELIDIYYKVGVLKDEIEVFARSWKPKCPIGKSNSHKPERLELE